MILIGNQRLVFHRFGLPLPGEAIGVGRSACTRAGQVVAGWHGTRVIAR
jgi:hypothetical protein